MDDSVIALLFLAVIYIVLPLIVILLPLASIYLYKWLYRKCALKPIVSNLTGSEVAKDALTKLGLLDVKIKISKHSYSVSLYEVRKLTIRLSYPHFHGNDVSSTTISALLACRAKQFASGDTSTLISLTGRKAFVFG
jgi:Zn-dependent membrane protease YugP